MDQTDHLQLAVAIATNVLEDSRSRDYAQEQCQALLTTVATKMAEPDYAAAQFQGRSTPFDMMVGMALEALGEG